MCIILSKRDFSESETSRGEQFFEFEGRVGLKYEQKISFVQKKEYIYEILQENAMTYYEEGNGH